MKEGEKEDIEVKDWDWRRDGENIMLNRRKEKKIREGEKEGIEEE